MQTAASPQANPTSVFEGWFTARGWQPGAHQLAFWAQARAGHDALLIAPTGGGKTLAGFVPVLERLAALPKAERGRLRALYISPLKALAVDVQRNLMQPVEEIGLDIRIETRSGDAEQSQAKAKAQSARYFADHAGAIGADAELAGSGGLFCRAGLCDY